MPISGGFSSEDPESLSINNEEIRASSPTIPDEVYTHLPDLLKEALKPSRNNRERDILLLGILINLSGCMPNVRIYYSRFVIYTCEARWKFRSAAPIGGSEDYVTLYKRPAGRCWICISCA